MRKVEVVPYDPEWRSQFWQEAEVISLLLGDNLIVIHHIGSTSIPGIYAKPIIDILIEVQDIHQVDSQSVNLQTLGYEAMGELGISGRRYFRKHNAAGDRTHHVHIFQTKHSEVWRHLAFRDYLRSHPAIAQAYSELKQKLAQQHPHDIDAYMDGKDGWIKAIEAKASMWIS
jgi:GrpB-like predicted nucleotidyltransferase (UPF0157 family)